MASGFVKFDFNNYESAITCLSGAASYLDNCLCERTGPFPKSIPLTSEKVIKYKTVQTEIISPTGTKSTSSKQELVYDYTSEATNYNKVISEIHSTKAQLGPYVLDYIKEVQAKLKKISVAITNYEENLGEIINLDDMAKEFDAESGYGIAVEDGQVYYLYQTQGENGEEGEIVKVSISELLNSFYTYNDASMSSLVAASIFAGSKGKELKDADLMEIVKNAKCRITKAEQAEAFGLASKEDIDNFSVAAFDVPVDQLSLKYPEMFNTEYNRELIDSLENSDLANAGDINGLIVNGSLVSGGFITAYTLTDFIGKFDDSKEDEEEEHRYSYENSNDNGEGHIEVLPGDVTGGVETINPDLPSVEPEPELPPEEPITQPEEPTPENPEPVIEPEVTPEVAQGVRDSISEFEGLNSPDKMDEIKLTSDDIDNQARDEYYSDPGLAEKRVSAISEFENMSNEERVSSLEALGYTTVVAAGLVADKATGQAAYIIGIDEQNMANMSNALALQNGITDHNTRFDDGHNLSYFESGQAGVDMTPSTAEVKKARADLTTARGNYNSAVTTANDAINEANESKEKYNNTLSSIKKKKGDNPEDWSKDDVDEYNKVAEEYNAAVKNAEKAVEDAQSKKVVYEAEKAKYDKAYEESVKKAQAGSQEAQDADDSDIINEMVPAEPDITEKVDDNGDFSTDPIPMVPPEELPSEQTPITPPQDVPTQGDSTQGSQLNPGEPVPDENNVYYEE